MPLPTWTSPRAIASPPFPAQPAPDRNLEQRPSLETRTTHPDARPTPPPSLKYATRAADSPSPGPRNSNAGSATATAACSPRRLEYTYLFLLVVHSAPHMACGRAYRQISNGNFSRVSTPSRHGVGTLRRSPVSPRKKTYASCAMQCMGGTKTCGTGFSKLASLIDKLDERPGGLAYTFQRILQSRAFCSILFSTSPIHEHPGIRSQVELKNEIFFQFLGQGLFSSCKVRMVPNATECVWRGSSTPSTTV